MKEIKRLVEVIENAKNDMVLAIKPIGTGQFSTHICIKRGDDLYAITSHGIKAKKQKGESFPPVVELLPKLNKMEAWSVAHVPYAMRNVLEVSRSEKYDPSIHFDRHTIGCTLEYDVNNTWMGGEIVRFVIDRNVDLIEKIVNYQGDINDFTKIANVRKLLK